MTTLTLVVNTPVLFLRAAPGTSQAVIGRVYAGDTLVVSSTIVNSGKDNYKWVALVSGPLGMAGGWVAMDYLAVPPPRVMAKRYILPPDGLRVRSAPGGPIMAALSQGTPILVETPLGTVVSGGFAWSRIDSAIAPYMDLKGGWVATRDLTNREDYVGLQAPPPRGNFGIRTGWHTVSFDNNDLAYMKRLYAAGKPMRGIFLLGPGDPNPAAIHEASPSTDIYERVWYPNPGKEYEPPAGWDHATREQGRALGDWYCSHWVDPFNDRRKYVRAHQVWNEAAQWSPQFVQWQHGVLDALEARGLFGLMDNFPPGFPGLVTEQKDGSDYRRRPDTLDFYRRVKAGGHLLNWHQGTLGGEYNVDNPYTSQRDVLIYKYLPADLRDIPLVCTEYYFTKPGLMDAHTLAGLLKAAEASLASRPYIRMLGIWTKGDSGGWAEDNYNHIAIPAWQEFTGVG